ncbi:hypothetical protein BDP27DRAFT_1452999 [Rhodocollybia butyracea]|uniref:Uncharacterized protein n=1 Tax=Rhodocollybia butyracea TaxID=206335 RepID=A0A9P5P6J7_9AGAR|nr:hypothetical protein BDP27DRAFT_1452999 [Rhodocollybia butyracea]
MTSSSPADLQTPEWVSGSFDNWPTPTSVSIRTPALSRSSAPSLTSAPSHKSRLDPYLPSLAVALNRTGS